MKKSFLGSLFFLAAVFFLYVRPVFDPDLGWHLRVGEYILEERKLPEKEIFSFALPEYNYVYHSWLQEVGLALIYKGTGLWGVTVFYGLVATLAFGLLGARKEGKWVLLAMVPLAAWLVGMRTQVVTFLGLVWLGYLFSRDWVWSLAGMGVLGVTFWLWANLHGGFILGLVFLGGLVLVNLKKKRWGWGEGLVLAGLLGSLLTPYVFRSFTQGIGMVGNDFAARFNIDWLPLFDADSRSQLFAFILVGLAGLAFWRMKNKREKILLGVFMLLALRSKRFILPILVLAGPALDWLGQAGEMKMKKLGKTALPIWISLGAAMIGLFLSSGEVWWKTAKAYAEEREYARLLPLPYSYPFEAVKRLREEENLGRIFNDYNWGGYLLWQLPGEKFFIDGRMDNFFYEGKSFGWTYDRILNLRKGWEAEFEKWQIDGVLLPPGSPLVALLRERANWEVIYEDEGVVWLKKVEGLTKEVELRENEAGLFRFGNTKFVCVG